MRNTSCHALRLISALGLVAALLLAGCNASLRIGPPDTSVAARPPKSPHVAVLEGVPISAISTATWLGEDGVINATIDWSNGAQGATITAYVGCPGLPASELSKYVPNATLTYPTVTRPTNLPANQQSSRKFRVPLTQSTSLPTPPPLVVIFVNSVQQGPAAGSITILAPKSVKDNEERPLEPISRPIDSPEK